MIIEDLLINKESTSSTSSFSSLHEWMVSEPELEYLNPVKKDGTRKKILDTGLNIKVDEDVMQLVKPIKKGAISHNPRFRSRTVIDTKVSSPVPWYKEKITRKLEYPLRQELCTPQSIHSFLEFIHTPHSLEDFKDITPQSFNYLYQMCLLFFEMRNYYRDDTLLPTELRDNIMYFFEILRSLPIMALALPQKDVPPTAIDYDTAINILTNYGFHPKYGGIVSETESQHQPIMLMEIDSIRENIADLHILIQRDIWQEKRTKPFETHPQAFSRSLTNKSGKTGANPTNIQSETERYTAVRNTQQVAVLRERYKTISVLLQNIERTVMSATGDTQINLADLLTPAQEQFSLNHDPYTLDITLLRQKIQSLITTQGLADWEQTADDITEVVSLIEASSFPTTTKYAHNGYKPVNSPLLTQNQYENITKAAQDFIRDHTKELKKTKTLEKRPHYLKSLLYVLLLTVAISPFQKYANETAKVGIDNLGAIHELAWNFILDWAYKPETPYELDDRIKVADYLEFLVNQQSFSDYIRPNSSGNAPERPSNFKPENTNLSESESEKSIEKIIYDIPTTDFQPLYPLRYTFDPVNPFKIDWQSFNFVVPTDDEDLPLEARFTPGPVSWLYDTVEERQAAFESTDNPVFTSFPHRSGEVNMLQASEQIGGSIIRVENLGSDPVYLPIPREAEFTYIELSNLSVKNTSIPSEGGMSPSSDSFSGTQFQFVVNADTRMLVILPGTFDNKNVDFLTIRFLIPAADNVNENRATLEESANLFSPLTKVPSYEERQTPEIDSVPAAELITYIESNGINFASIKTKVEGTILETDSTDPTVLAYLTTRVVYQEIQAEMVRSGIKYSTDPFANVYLNNNDIRTYFEAATTVGIDCDGLSTIQNITTQAFISKYPYFSMQYLSSTATSPIRTTVTIDPQTLPQGIWLGSHSEGQDNWFPGQVTHARSMIFDPTHQITFEATQFLDVYEPIQADYDMYIQRLIKLGIVGEYQPKTYEVIYLLAFIGFLMTFSKRKQLKKFIGTRKEKLSHRLQNLTLDVVPSLKELSPAQISAIPELISILFTDSFQKDTTIDNLLLTEHKINSLAKEGLLDRLQNTVSLQTVQNIQLALQTFSDYSFTKKHLTTGRKAILQVMQYENIDPEIKPVLEILLQLSTALLRFHKK